MSQNQKPTQFYATLSTSIVLVLISLFLLIFFHSGNITNIVKENLNILVELENDLPSGEVQRLQDIIKDYNGVIPQSVEFLSKEYALEFMSKELVINQDENENPFNDIIKFNLKSDQYSEDRIKAIKKEIEYEKGVRGLYYENESLDMVQSNLEKVSFGILILALCFVILAISIIFSTVQLTLYSNVKEIRTMQLVGAEKSFVKKPYLKAAFFMGIKAIIVTLIFIAGLWAFLYYSDSIFAEIIQWYYVVLTVLICIVLAFIILLGTTNRMINKFLQSDKK
ncbi:MAG: permease-like cell division protein FtsX [Saprospiraceae bacterium]|nr:MAG: cell division protein FtsX [Bacteroidetes bacterium OLB9]MCO6464555.1 permease-like cell division protein FtsX [Saprospiraceae bacterium]MCZ2338995.1 permease-like cell division protein FtsX [Chitinophagales bacterium]